MSEDWSEDAVIARIQEESLRHYHEVELPRRASCVKNEEIKIDNDEPSSDAHFSQSTEISLSKNDVFYRGPEPGADGFHMAAGETYIYPTNYPIRDYQVNIVRSSLFHNTLVCLPTGLGKTFIAAVVMYNYYRWFPRGKIVFMAPTRPLVAQQIRACHDIMGIPAEDTIEMTGTLNPIERVAYWKMKRVFFLTPQVLANDLRSNVCPAKSFKCVVVDEAHRATKEYAYCQVVRALEDAKATFRILALSATPGNNVKAVVEVIQNLRISKLEMRGDESLDVSKYTHAKNVQPIAVQLTKEILNIREDFMKIFEKYARSLREAKIITANAYTITKFQLLKASERIKSQSNNGMSKTTIGYLMSDMTVCMSLAHALELLQIYGLQAFEHYLTANNEEGDKSTAAFTRLKKDGELYELLSKLRKMTSETQERIWSHPKLERMVDVIKEHFSSAEQCKSTKAIIFCQYRIVVCEVYNILQKLDSTIKPIMFVGQSSCRDKGGLPQRKQLEVMKKFRDGEYNVMIATCVAEEGLDIGEVDLLILMEAHRSPVRLVQRLGRTGRHREGRCVVLLTQGKEVQKFKDAMETRKAYVTTMMNSSVIMNSLFENEPSMLPPGVQPKQQLLHIHVTARVTPGKHKRQTDIRSAFCIKNAAIQPRESAFLSPDQTALVVEELGKPFINMGRINTLNPTFLWPRMKDTLMKSEELFSTNHSYLSEWNDWNRSLQQTLKVGHSTNTEILCHLLNKADRVQGYGEAIIGLNPPDFVMQSDTKVNMIDRKEVGENPKDKTLCLKQKLDIRNCFALAEEKSRITQQKLWDEFNMSQKVEETIIPNHDDFHSSVPNVDEVVIISDKENSNIRTDQCQCIFFTNTNIDSNLFENKILIPTPNVKPTSCYFHADKSVHSKDWKNDLKLSCIEQIDVKEMFKNVKNVKFDKCFPIHKHQARVLMDVKNTLSQHPSTNLRLVNATGSQNECHFSLKVKITDEADRSNSEHIDDSTFNITSTTFGNLGNSFTKNDNYEHTPIDTKETKHLVTNICNISDKGSFSVRSSNQMYVEKLDKFNEVTHTFDKSFFQKIDKNSSTEKEYLNLKRIDNKLNKTFKPLKCPSKKDNLLFDEIEFIKETSNKFIEESENKKVQEDFVDIDDLFIDDFNWSNLQITSNVSTPKIKNKAITSMKHDSLSKSININENSFNLTSSQSVNQSNCKNIIQFEIPEKLESKSIIASDDNDTDFELSPILSGKPLQGDNNKLEQNISKNRSQSWSKNNYFENSNSLKNPNNSDLLNTKLDEICVIKTEDWSADQLFNQSCNEKKYDDENYTMYTVSQLVRKSSDICDQNSTKNKTNNLETEDINCERSPSIFKNISRMSLNTSPSSSNLKTANHSYLRSKDFGHDQNKLTLAKSRSIQLKESIKEVPTNFQSEPLLASGWLNEKKVSTSSNNSLLNRSLHWLNDSDSDTNSDIFASPEHEVNKKKPFKFKFEQKKSSKKQAVRKEADGFLENEADVSGPHMSSDEENTSGLDDLDESFIDDLTQCSSTSANQTTHDMQAVYLQAVRSPKMRTGGFKIPKISESVLQRDAYSQSMIEDPDSYIQDSFCVDETEIIVNEPSILEIAEQILEKRKRKKKRKYSSSSNDVNDRLPVKRKRKVCKIESDSETES